MLIYYVYVPIVIAVFLYIFSLHKVGKIVALALQAAFVGASFHLFTLVRNQGDITTHIGNYESVLGIALRADTLSTVFILLTTVIFLVAGMYSFHEKNSRLYWALFFIWEGTLIGLFLVRDFFNVFVLLEVMTIIVSILIMFKRDKRSMYEGMVYMMVNIVATQFYLFGVGYLYMLTGVLDLDVAAEVMTQINPSSLFLPYALIMTAVAFKCALLPLFSWLPKAHGTPGAPSAVSALLSGLQIKAGVYLFIRMQEVFAPVAMTDFFLIIGILTGIAGIILAMSQTDIKLILAYSTVAQIGLIFIGLNLPGYYSFIGSLYHVMNHALFKAALFLSAGMIKQAYDTREITEIRGLFRRIPVVAIATLVAILGITGTPLLNGSISKYFIMAGAGPVLTWTMIFINLGTILIFIRYATMLFGRPKEGLAPIRFEKIRPFSVLVLASLCFMGGIFGEWIIEYLFQVSVSVDAAGYAEKVFIFFASWFVGIVLYRFLLKPSKLLPKIKTIDLNFRGICVSTGLFFAVMLVALHLGIG